MTLTPAVTMSLQNFGPNYGRGDLETRVIATIRTWIVTYIANYEREHQLPSRSIVVPPTPASIHGGIDFETFSSELFPEIIVVCQPSGEAERIDDDGGYGSWFTVDVGAVVQYEGDQDKTRQLADAYGTALQLLVPQQGYFGYQADGTTYFATRTRLEAAYSVVFPDETVRDIARATLPARTFVNNLGSDFEGPTVPPADPYAVPLPLPVANRVEVDLIRGTPDTSGFVSADGVLLDGTVSPPVKTYRTTTVNEPPDTIPK